MVIPILFVGSITVLLNGFPIQAYQDFLDSYLGGGLRSIILTVQRTTVGVLAVYITIALNYSYLSRTEKGPGTVSGLGSLLSCLTGFFILVGFFSGEPDLSLLSGQGVFSALVAGITGPALYRRFESAFVSRKIVFADGADSVFNASLQVILPFLSVTLIFSVANHLITTCLSVVSVQYLFTEAVNSIFIRMQRSYSSGLLFTTLTSILWWFGVHGNNVLNQVAEDMFTVIIPGEVVSKSFIDTFVNMGGTGCTIGLLFAMMVFGKRSSTKKLSGMALLPGVFNIGELLVFGFPVIYNPVMAAPFILAPILCFSNAFILTKAGFLPYVTTSVVWTTPALMSGFIATGSVRGILVQLMNILISTACYAPFVVWYEKRSLDEFSSEMDGLIRILKESEESGEEDILTECEGNAGRLARLLATDLEGSLSDSSPDRKNTRAENPLLVECEKQYNGEGKCTGTNAFFRWAHIRHGEVYPPLVLRIAEESGDLYRLETYVIEKAVQISGDLKDPDGQRYVMKVSVSASTVKDKRFIPFARMIADHNKLRAGDICLMIREEKGAEDLAELTGVKRNLKSLGYSI